MSLVYAGICTHAPALANRPGKADPIDLREFKDQFDRRRLKIEGSRPDALL